MSNEDQRKHHRVESINLSYICLDQSETVVQQAMARTINISKGGFLIETHFKMQAGFTLIATIGLEDETIDLKGKVVHVQDGEEGKFVAGIEITSIESGDQSTWADFISKFPSSSSDTAIDI